MIQQSASLFIVVFTVINIVACLWLMWWTANTRNQTEPNEGEGPGTTGHVWDGDLQEYNNPLPRWWLGLFIITVLFGAAYLTFFPGLGNFAGTSRWSSVGAYEEQVQRQREKFDAQLAAFGSGPLHELAANGSAMATAKNLFSANCAGCHGSDARGAKGFPNLTDKDWLWGGAEARIVETISQGRQGMMPAWGPVLGEAGVNEVASYVLSLSGAQAPADWIAAGRTRYEATCIGCHGADAKGNELLGAPNLTDGVWLHGGDFDSVRASIANGRQGQMPAQEQALGQLKVRLLAAYVMSLSHQDPGYHASNR